MADLPILVGSGAACGLRVEGPGVREVHGEVGLAEGGGLVYRPRPRGRAVALEPGTRFRVAAFQVELTREAPAGGADLDRPLRVVLEALPGLRGAPQPEDALPLLLATLRRGFGASWGAVVDLRPGEGHGGSLFTEGTRADAENQRVSTSVLRQLAEGTEPVLTTDVHAIPELARAASIPASVHSVLAARLEVPGGAAAAIYLESPAESRAFTDPERLLLEHLCALVADQLARSREARALRVEADRLGELQRRSPDGRPGLDPLVGDSPAMRSLRADLDKAASCDVTVLVVGETGAGKELVARELHRRSTRAAAPFVALNCAAIPEGLAESELFGHEAGAFSGAQGRRLGRFELAHRGTLFLDELGDLPPELQPKLLRALEDRSVQRLGSGEAHPVDVRVIAATHRDLEAQVAAGTFREDLFYRLSVFVLRVPPLRERIEDLPALVERLLEQIAARVGRPVEGLEPEAMAALRAYRWPGNVRELSNVLEQGCVRAVGPVITRDELVFLPALQPGEPEDPADFHQARQGFERRFLLRVLRECGGDTEAVGARIGLSRSQVYRKCNELGISLRSIRRG